MNARWRLHMTTPAADASPLAALVAIIANLRRLLWLYPDKIGPATDPVAAYIGRVARRLFSLIGRLQAGTWAPPRPRAPSATKRADRPNPNRVRFSRRRGWLMGAVGWELAGFCGQFAHQLNDPDMLALLEPARAQVSRLLRPFARMCLLRLDIVDPLPRRPRKPRPKPRLRPHPTRPASRQDSWSPAAPADSKKSA